MNYDAVREEISRTYNFMEFCTVLILFLDATLFKGNETQIMQHNAWYL